MPSDPTAGFVFWSPTVFFQSNDPALVSDSTALLTVAMTDPSLVIAKPCGNPPSLTPVLYVHVTVPRLLNAYSTGLLYDMMYTAPPDEIAGVDWIMEPRL
jgi:hypothetical protein